MADPDFVAPFRLNIKDVTHLQLTKIELPSLKKGEKKELTSSKKEKSVALFKEGKKCCPGRTTLPTHTTPFATLPSQLFEMLHVL